MPLLPFPHRPVPFPDCSILFRSCCPPFRSFPIYYSVSVLYPVTFSYSTHTVLFLLLSVPFLPHSVVMPFRSCCSVFCPFSIIFLCRFVPFVLCSVPFFYCSIPFRSCCSIFRSFPYCSVSVVLCSVPFSYCFIPFCSCCTLFRSCTPHRSLLLSRHTISTPLPHPCVPVPTIACLYLPLHRSLPVPLYRSFLPLYNFTSISLVASFLCSLIPFHSYLTLFHLFHLGLFSPVSSLVSRHAVTLSPPARLLLERSTPSGRL